MSKIKTPLEKKHLRLERDRRNLYGEHSKGSRKTIARGKKLQRREERRGVSQLLGGLISRDDDDASSVVELRVKSKSRETRIHGFKKRPDRPLKEAIARKLQRRRELGMRGARDNGTV